MNAYKYTALSPMFHWVSALTVLFVLFVPDVPLGRIKAALMALYFTLVILALFFEVAPPFVTRREADHANKHRSRKGMSYASEPVMGVLLHKVVMRNESGKRERLPPFALWLPVSER